MRIGGVEQQIKGLVVVQGAHSLSAYSAQCYAQGAAGRVGKLGTARRCSCEMKQFYREQVLMSLRLTFFSSSSFGLLSVPTPQQDDKRASNVGIGAELTQNGMPCVA